MFTIQSNLRKEVVSHLFFWFLLVYFALVQFNRSNPYFFTIAEPDFFEVSWALVFIATFYFNYLLAMPRVFKDFTWKKAMLGYLSGYVFFVGLRFLMEEIMLPFFIGQSNYTEGTPGLYYLYDNLYYSTLPLIPSTFFWLIVFLIRQLQAKNITIEENRNTEVKFLKAQLNPHFLFNTLNNIYSMVYLQSEKALPAIEKLSEIMRFTTYELQKETIELEKEINYIQSFVELEKLRHEGNCFVSLNLIPEKPELRLPPFLLFPLVENALKHGSNTADTPLEIQLELNGNNLNFRVMNAIGVQKKDQIGGIGLENLQKRLEIYYPGMHLLRLTSENGKFTAQLEIHF